MCGGKWCKTIDEAQNQSGINPSYLLAKKHRYIAETCIIHSILFRKEKTKMVGILNKTIKAGLLCHNPQNKFIGMVFIIK